MCDLITSFVVSALASALVVFLIWVYQQWRYFYHLHRCINGMEYNVFLKRDYIKPIFKIKCVTKKNLLIFDGTKLDDETKFSGEIIMNPFSLRIGNGYFIHPDYSGFGFMEVFIVKKGEELYVEAPFTNSIPIEKDGRKVIATSRVYQAFVWKKVN